MRLERGVRWVIFAKDKSTSQVMRELLSPGNYYHIYNRGNNRELLFFEEADFQNFLDRYHKYLGDIFETYAWCLIPNHFHFLIRVKDTGPWGRNLKGNRDEACKIISTRMRLFLMSYAKRINMRRERYGSLMVKNFRRKKVGSTEYLKQLVIYIHSNPGKHRLSKDQVNYKWCSLGEYQKMRKVYCELDEVIRWYGGKQNFLESHEQFLEKPDLEFWDYFGAL